MHHSKPPALPFSVGRAVKTGEKPRAVVASCYSLLLIARMLLVVMPFVTSSDALVTSSFLLLVMK